jgi:rhodanese-related sulfurtransferase
MSMKKSFNAIVCVSVLMLAACGRKEKVEGGAGDGLSAKTLRVVNVLDKALFDDAHIKGSVNVPLATLAETLKTWNKEDEIIFYCSNFSCASSIDAAKQAKDAGFANVAVYEGGMAEWYQLAKQDKSFEVEGAAKEAYLEVAVAKPEAQPAGIVLLPALEVQKKLVAALAVVVPVVQEEAKKVEEPKATEAAKPETKA